LHPTVPTAMDTTVSNAEAEDEQHKPTHRQILVGEIIFCMHGQSCMKSIENKKKLRKSARSALFRVPVFIYQQN